MENKVGFLVSRIKQLNDRVMTRVLSRNGINEFNGPQGRILYVLWQKDGVPIRDVSEKTGLAKTTLTGMLAHMQDIGLIDRVYDRGDKRKTLIVLTEKARSLQKQADMVSVAMNGIAFDGFNEEEIGKLEVLLEKMCSNLEKHI